jgi:3-oxoacyl-[acyl-carrier protein] reductase
MTTDHEAAPAGRLAGKTALVTGSSRGLGAVMARAFAREGANVVVNYRTGRDEAEEVVASIKELGAGAVAVEADCTDAAAVARMLDVAVNTFGEVRILVNNAGIGGGSAALVATTLDDWEAMMASHLRSHFLVTTACLERSMLGLCPLTGERRAAKIINIGSGLVRRQGRAAAQKVPYMTAKAGVVGFTHGLAAELAPLITVNAIEPGIHFTGMVGQPPADVQAALGDLFLLGLAEDRDVASMATFLASAEGDHLTAQVMLTSGGIA